jgi:hypothetical protein
LVPKDDGVNGRCLHAAHDGDVLNSKKKSAALKGNKKEAVGDNKKKREKR